MSDDCTGNKKKRRITTYLGLTIVLLQRLYTGLVMTTIGFNLLIGEIKLRRVDCAICWAASSDGQRQVRVNVKYLSKHYYATNDLRQGEGQGSAGVCEQRWEEHRRHRCSQKEEHNE